MPKRLITKQRMSYIMSEDSHIKSDICRNNASVTESIQRGRAALAEAEGHIRMFEEYLQSSSNQFGIPKDEDIMRSKHQHIVLHFDDCDQSDGSKANNNSSLDHSLDSGKQDPIVSHLLDMREISQPSELIDRLMRDGEARMKRDELISSELIQGNDLYKRKISRNLEECIDKPTVKLKTNQNFDPANLSAARRAAIREAKTSEETRLKNSKQDYSQFKARPLPGGGEVINNPYALTKAAIGKRNQARTSNCNDGTVVPFSPSQTNKRLDASVILGGDMSFSSVPRPGSAVSWRSHESKRYKIRDEIYKATTDLVEREFTFETTADESLSEEEKEQDLTDLHQQIARLKAELKIKRNQCVDTIQILEDETQCKCLEDIGIPELVKDRFDKSGGSHDKTSDACEESSKIQLNLPNLNGKDCMYTRQKIWLDKLERKKQEAKAREDNYEVKNLTGVPDLGRAKLSWAKAKQEHDGLLKSAKEKERVIQREKLKKDRQHHLTQAEEAEKIQILAKEKAKAVKRGVDRELQAEFVDKLSRPIHRISSKRPTKQPSPEKAPAELDKAAALNKNEGEEDKTASFADMNDKEFAKMIKKIQARAKKESKKKYNNMNGERSLKGDEGRKDKSPSIVNATSVKKKRNTAYSPYKSRK